MLSTREQRFIRYTMVGVSTFALDLALLWTFIDILRMQYLIATAVAFLIAVSLNYLISRQLVFRRSQRALLSGYIYFLQFAILGIILTTSLMWLFTEHLHWHYAVARVIIAAVVGIGNYLANLYFNFRVSGQRI